MTSQLTVPLAGEIETVVDAIQARLPAVETWRIPPGYPNSVGLCVLDAIWSIGVNYDHHVVPVLHRYVQHRNVSISTCCDTAADLADVIAAAGGPVGFANSVVHNRQLTSTRGGVLKAEACLRAALLLRDAEVTSPPDLLARANDIERWWRQIPGQRSGISWAYLLMLGGQEGVKPDRMILRFLQDELSRSVSAEEATALLRQVAQHPSIDVTASVLDHAIWQHVRPKRRAKT